MKTVAIALSGGIDSALTAYLLKKEGHNVLGLHADFGYRDHSSQTWLARITDFLQIPLNIISLKEDFQKQVVDYFVSEYRRGRTPNPCVLCNPSIKFGLLYQNGIHLGADAFATGHYARVLPAPWGEGLALARGIDSNKDQSYFLHRLGASKLNRILLPLGVWTKDQVRKMVQEIGLPIPPDGESQDICFLPKGGYREFLRRQTGRELDKAGDIINLKEEKLAGHCGLYAYTVGQRRGLGIPASEPYYVIRLEPENNRVVIGFKTDLESAGCRLSGLHLFRNDLDEAEIWVQIRYRHKPVQATIKIEKEGRGVLHFHKPQKAVTPGQAAVLYEGDYVLGGGWIEETWK
ncbi:MAG TPA: tRNA 2-thiouridine(34) synthase MnmA [Thermodesulfobacteriota bacterium]|nr:tRNA 2-thiouridine(34) synthase MnmA [Thermodesulfobacteriota bacterium]